MSERYSRDGRSRPSRLGFVLLVVPSMVAAVLLILAVVYATGIPSREDAGHYVTLATPANQSLDAEVDGYTDNQRDDLAAARADLTREVKTELAFDRSLASIQFPASIAAIAHALIQVNEARAVLTSLQAKSPSLRVMRSFDSRDAAANAAAEVQARRIRQALGLSPPSTS